MDIRNSIMDIHNYRVYALLSFHMSQLIHIKKYLFKICLGTSDHLEIRVSYSKKSLKWNRVEGCFLQHGCYWWLGACLATGSTATVVGNGYLQVVTCKYLIFCSLDKYKLLVPHQVCAFAQKRLIELKSTLVGGARGLINFRPRSAELPLLLSHGCPIIGRAAPMHFYTNCSDWAQIWWENPRWDCPCLSRRSRQSWPKRTSMLVPISPKKEIFFNGKRKFSKSRKRGSFYS